MKIPLFDLNNPNVYTPFYVLIISMVLNLFIFFVCYRMIHNHEEDMSMFIFEHQNYPLKYHPIYDQFYIRLNEVEYKVDVLFNDCKQ